MSTTENWHSEIIVSDLSLKFFSGNDLLVFEKKKMIAELIQSLVSSDVEERIRLDVKFVSKYDEKLKETLFRLDALVIRDE